VAELCCAREIALRADGKEISDLVHFHKDTSFGPDAADPSEGPSVANRLIKWM